MNRKQTVSCNCNASSKSKKRIKNGTRLSVLNMITGIVLFLFPKCPICWAAYASMFSIFGLEKIGYQAEWKYILLVIFLMGSFLFLRKHFLKKSWLNILIYMTAMVILLTVYLLNITQTWWLIPVGLLIAISNLSIERYFKISL